MEVRTLQQHEIQRDVVDGTLDLGLVNLLDGDDLPPDLHGTDLLSGRPVAVLPRDHPLATSIGPHGPAEHTGGLLPWAVKEYEQETGHKVLDDFPEWEPCHRAILSNGIYGFENVGGDLDKVTGKRVTFAAFPWRWVGGDGCIVRLVAIVDPTGNYRIDTGKAA